MRLLLVWGVCILSFSCAAPPPTPPRRVEAPPPSPERNPLPDPVPPKRNLPPPELAEIRSAVSRVFRDVVTVEEGRKPHFLVGDFNGDRSQDLAVIVKPAAGKLAWINDELAGWILVDPAASAARQRVSVNDNELLLAVIHGFGSSGWRHSQATQTYVLKQVAEGPMRVRSRPSGDVIEQTIQGQAGFVYYNGAKYGWYDPRADNPFPKTRIYHTAKSGN